MLPTGEATPVRFSGLVLQLRGRIGLTQRELAQQMGVHAHSIQGWESGANYPGVASLKALIVAGVRAGGFTSGREAAEATELWAAAVRDSPRFRTPFDRVWFERLCADILGPAWGKVPAPGNTLSPVVPAALSSQGATGGPRRDSWGEAPDVTGFLGRATEREQLTQWVRNERCRVLAICGLGGIGKTLLGARLAHDLAPSFEHVYWRSLRDAPTPGEWLAEAIGFLAPDEPNPSRSDAEHVWHLGEQLNKRRCLLVLDNFETILEPGGLTAGYRPGFERYGTLLRQLAETSHQSCLVLTTREDPPELASLRSEHGPVRALHLGGLGHNDGRALLGDKDLDGDDTAWQALVSRYSGNGLALKIVGETTREMFGGSITEYLAYAADIPGVLAGGVRELLEAQIQRLSEPEQELLRRMAVAREPVSLAELAASLAPRLDRGTTLEAVDGLRRRSLLERVEARAAFTLQSVVLEYVTERLVEEVTRELDSRSPVLLLRQPLLNAMGKEYVRRSQERLIAGPLLERLVATRGSTPAAEHWLLDLLDTQRGKPVADQGYGPGNLVNLLRQLRGDLTGLDLSRLAIRQAHLADVRAQGSSLVGAHLSETLLGEAFSHSPSLALSGDGAYLVAGTSSGEVFRWRLADRTLLATLTGHTGTVYGVAMSGDGQLIASGGVDKDVRLWDATTGRLLASLHGHTGPVRGVALSGDGRRVASASLDGTVRVWDGERGQHVAVLREHNGEVYCVALSADGQLVASGSLDGTVRLWNAESGQPLATLEGHAGLVLSVSMSDDGRLVASGGVDGTVRLWTSGGGQPLATLRGHTGLILAVALSGDGRLVASAGADGLVRLWEAAGGRLLNAFPGHTGMILTVALNGDGRLVASGSVDGTARLWEVESGQSLATVQGHISGIMAVALASDGHLAVCGSVDGMVRLWDTGSGRLLATLTGHAGAVRGVALSHDGRLVASGGVDGAVRLWSVESGRLLATLMGHTGVVRGVALSGDGRLVASGGVDGTVRLWSAERGQLLSTLADQTAGVLNVALSRDGRLIASGGIDGTVHLWDTESGKLLLALRGHPGGVWGVAFDEAGSLVAGGGDDGTVRIWDVSTGQELPTLRGHTDAVRNVALSEDGRLAASCSFDGTVRLWDVRRGQELVSLRAHVGGIWAMALSGDGEIAISGGDDGTVRVWAPSTRACLRTLQADRRYERLDITGVTGITEAQRGALIALGAVESKGVHA